MAGSCCRINSMSVPESLSWSPSRGQWQRVGEALGEGRTRLLLQPQHQGGDVGGAAGLRAEQHAAQQGRHPGGLLRTEVSSRAWGVMPSGSRRRNGTFNPFYSRFSVGGFRGNHGLQPRAAVARQRDSHHQVASSLPWLPGEKRPQGENGIPEI